MDIDFHLPSRGVGPNGVFENNEIPKEINPFEIQPHIPMQNAHLIQIQEKQNERAREILKKKIEEEKIFNLKLYGTQLGLALAGGLIIAIVCISINPPITQYYHEDPFTMTNQDWRKVLLLVAIVVILIFLIPEISRLFGW
jgi:hypothetical protein